MADLEKISKLIYNYALSIIDNKNKPLKDFGKPLREFLRYHSAKKVLLIQPGGNNGDLLIYFGLKKLLTELRIKYVEISAKSLLFSLYNLILYPIKGRAKYFIPIEPIRIPDDVDLVIIHGGANFNDIWLRSIRIIRHLLNVSKVPVVVAPQTYYFYRTYLPKIFNSSKIPVYLFCREKISYNHISRFRLPNNVEIYLSDDTALYLNRRDFEKFSNLRLLSGNYNLDTRNKAILLAFRKDIEKIPNTDTLVSCLSDLFKDHGYHTINKDISVNVSFERFVNFVSNANLVITNRLHVGILSSILSKPTILLSNSYFKNKAVYDYSLKYFSKTTFLEFF